MKKLLKHEREYILRLLDVAKQLLLEKTKPHIYQAIGYASDILQRFDPEKYNEYGYSCLVYLHDWYESQLGRAEGLDDWLQKVAKIDILKDPNKDERMRLASIDWIDSMTNQLLQEDEEVGEGEGISKRLERHRG